MDVDSVEEAVRARRKTEPAWNDLREQRVLGRIGEARRRRAVSPRRLTVASGAVAAAALIGVLIWRAMPGAPSTESAAAPPARLDLADGSVALLSADARVGVDAQRADGIFLTQEAGTVTYEVTHDPARAFVVRAMPVTVTVRGTRFVVAMDPAFVEVRVEAGRVEVRGNGNEALLAPGERIRVARGGSVEPPAPVEQERVEPAPVERAEPQEEPAPAPRVRRSPRRAQAPVREEVRSLEELQREADDARRAGRTDDAARILRDAVALHPDDPRVPGALFTLGRLERRRGRDADAAEAFLRAREVAPGGPLAEDALAEAAVSFHEAGVPLRAQEAARSYLDAYPEGLHAQRMRALLP